MSQGQEFQCILFEGHNSPSTMEEREGGKPRSQQGEGELPGHAWVFRQEKNLNDRYRLRGYVHVSVQTETDVRRSGQVLSEGGVAKAMA